MSQLDRICAATHAVILLEETVSALKEKIIATYLKEKLGDFFNRNNQEKSDV